MTKTVMQLETLTCPSCVAKIEKAVSKLDHVEHVEVGFNSSRVSIESKEKINHDLLLDTVTRLGFDVITIR